MEFKNGMVFEYAGWSKVLNRWTKNGKDRIYINNENRKTCGYIDLVSGEVVWSAYCYSVMPGAAEYTDAIKSLVK